MTWILCPLGSAEDSATVEACHSAQSHPFRLLVVANGCEYTGRADHVITLPHRSLVDAMDAGLFWLLANESPDAIVARWDAGDEYGRDYCRNVARAFDAGARWTGERSVRVQFAEPQMAHDGRMHHRVRWSPGTGCPGGTVAARLAYFAPWPEFHARHSDDGAWCKAMGADGFVDRAHGDYTWIRRRGSVSFDALPDSVVFAYGSKDIDTGEMIVPCFQTSMRASHALTRVHHA